MKLYVIARKENMSKKKELIKAKDWDTLSLVFTTAKDFDWKVSILINNPLPEHVGKGYESYVGKVHSVNSEFVALDLIHNTRLSKIIVRKSLILSVWIYR